MAPERSLPLPRRPRRETDCRLHHITTRGNNRRSMFEDDDDRERFYDLLARRARREQRRVPPGRADGQPRPPAAGGRDHRRLDGAVVRQPPLRARLQPAPRTHQPSARSQIPLVRGARHARRPRRLRLHRDEPRPRRAVHAPGRLGVRLLPQPRGRGQMPRAHIQPDLTRQLFAARGTTFAAADGGGTRTRTAAARPPLAAILPPADRLTPAHVRHARQLYGYTVPEIAAHYRRSARHSLPWLASRGPS